VRIGVVVFPGSNCDRDAAHSMEQLGHEVVMLWHKDAAIADFTPEDCIILPGGFSFGDYLRSGAIARFSPIVDAIKQHAEAGGKVLGICNGFQVLCEMGLLPGALARNNNQRFSCKDVYLRVESTTSALTYGLQGGEVLRIPIAHAEGRYVISNSGLQELHDNNQIVVRYCNADGQIDQASNPNGSMDDIAGVSNKHGNVVGLMPHPERAAENVLGNADGRVLLECLSKSLDLMHA